MSIPVSLPVRRIQLETNSCEELVARQPERRRSIVQLAPGALHLELREAGWGRASIQSESWSHGIHLVVDRPPGGYLTFGFITHGRGRWMGAAIGAGSVLQIDRPWECVSEGGFRSVAFAVDQAAFEARASDLSGPDRPAFGAGNRVCSRVGALQLANALQGYLDHLLRSDCEPRYRSAVADALVQYALELARLPELIPVERLSTARSRLAAVRRIRAYLEDQPTEIPTIPILCRVAGVSERTLQYAFQESLGMTPLRYLKLRRLGAARRRLQDPAEAGVSVTDVALDCGFLQLGRFAGEYHALFGELPSETRRRSQASARGVASVPHELERIVRRMAARPAAQKKYCARSPSRPAGS